MRMSRLNWIVNGFGGGSFIQFWFATSKNLCRGWHGMGRIENWESRRDVVAQVPCLGCLFIWKELAKTTNTLSMTHFVIPELIILFLFCSISISFSSSGLRAYRCSNLVSNWICPPHRLLKAFSPPSLMLPPRVQTVAGCLFSGQLFPRVDVLPVRSAIFSPEVSWSIDCDLPSGDLSWLKYSHFLSSNRTA